MGHCQGGDFDHVAAQEGEGGVVADLRVARRRARRALDAARAVPAVAVSLAAGEPLEQLVARPITYGYSLYYIWSQPLLHTVTASSSW